MAADAIYDQIQIYARQLKLPTFTAYPDVVRQAGQNANFGTLLLELMKRETEKRHENQKVRLMKQAAFPYTKTVEELDMTQYSGRLTDILVQELARYQFIRARKTCFCWVIQGARQNSSGHRSGTQGL